MPEHPIELAVDDDLRRSRLTVLFRLLLAIPHFIWVALWTIAAFFAAVLAWVIALFAGRVPESLHGFLSAYVRYTAHLSAYVGLSANPFPGFTGSPGYPVDVTLPERAPQRRWKILLRLVLALPALLLAGGFFVGSGARSHNGEGASAGTGVGGLGSLLGVSAFLGWFASLATARMPKGLRDAGAYAIGYRAQALAYALLLTERYPNADPHALLTTVERPPRHAVRLVGDSTDLRRSRVTVLFRLPLAIPHLVWLILWSIAGFLVAIVQWFATLFAGRPAPQLHRFLARLTRYSFHVSAFLFLVANPFPGFTGAPGQYPLDVELPPPARQNRWKTGFRGLLAIPAFIVASTANGVLLIAAVFIWFYALVKGSAPEGLRNAGAYAIRYGAQANAYFFFVTDAYPHASPLEGAEPEPEPDEDDSVPPPALSEV
jgi:uncharacterized protein DUF4389